LGIKFRNPYWLAAGELATLTVNGEVICVPDEGGYFEETRVWNAGDLVELTLPADVRVSRLPDNQNAVAFMYGPLVLSAGMGTQNMVAEPQWASEKAVAPPTPAKDTIAITSGTIEDWIANIGDNLVQTPGQLEFTLRNTDEDGNLRFTPQYQRYQDRYGIYFRLQGQQGSPVGTGGTGGETWTNCAGQAGSGGTGGTGGVASGGTAGTGGVASGGTAGTAGLPSGGTAGTAGLPGGGTAGSGGVGASGGTAAAGGGTATAGGGTTAAGGTAASSGGSTSGGTGGTEQICSAGLTLCSGVCVNLAADAANCGQCGVVCASDQVCSVGVCTGACASGLTECGGACVDLNTDILNCGACGTACLTGQVCAGGQCTGTATGGDVSVPVSVDADAAGSAAAGATGMPPASSPGCGCVTPATRPTGLGAVLSMLLGVALLGRRRRRPA
jgi:hypothetical protein